MSNQQGKPDPLEQWRELRDTYMDIWAKASGEAVNSDAYAQATGSMLDAFLATSSPYRDAQKKAMVQALEQCNMPSREDYIRMADRLGNLELLLDDMDAKLRQMYQLMSRVASVQPARKAVSQLPTPASHSHVAAASEESHEVAEAAPAPALVAPEEPAADVHGSAAAERAVAPQRAPKNGEAKSKARTSTKTKKKGV